MKKGIYFGFVVVLMACSQSEESASKTTDGRVEMKATKVESVPVRDTKKSDGTAVPTSTVSKNRTFNGSWFSVEFPKDFSASPLSPEKQIDDYSFVETDEARFTSPDGTVEFFIYSPQWSGNPKDYLIQQSNEKIVDEMEESTSDIPQSMARHWVTFEDKEGNYTRAYHAIRTPSTHLVFGVKYTDRKSYERYKAMYIEFQESLRQYAD